MILHESKIVELAEDIADHLIRNYIMLTNKGKVINDNVHYADKDDLAREIREYIPRKQRGPRVCRWKYSEYFNGEKRWRGSCGTSAHRNDDDKENFEGRLFCSNCGKLVKFVEPKKKKETKGEQMKKQ